MINGSRTRLVLFLVLVGYVMHGCANKGATSKVEPIRTPIKKVAILPIQEPRKYVLDKAIGGLVLLGAIGQLINSVDTTAKAEKFAQAMKAQQPMVGKELMDSLESGLISEGYEVITLREQDMGYADPSDYDYRKVKSDADAIVHVWIKDAGVASPTTSVTYKPQLNIRAKVISMRDYQERYDEDFDYGSDAMKADEGNIPAEAKYRWGTFGSLIEKIPEVAEGLHVGARLLGARAAKGIHTGSN